MSVKRGCFYRLFPLLASSGPSLPFHLSLCSLLERSHPSAGGHAWPSSLHSWSLLQFRYTIPTACRIFPPKWTHYVAQSGIHYFPFKTFFLFLASLFLLNECVHNCLKPESHLSVFCLGIILPLSSPHQPQLISHKIQHAYFLNIFLKVPLLHITQPWYFLPGPLQDHSQLVLPTPTNTFFTLWTEWWADNNTTTSKHSPLEHPQVWLDSPKTQTRYINQEYSAILQPSHHSPPKTHPFQISWNSPQKVTLSHSSVSLNIQPLLLLVLPVIHIICILSLPPCHMTNDKDSLLGPISRWVLLS